MPQLFTNNAWGTLASQLNAGATSLALSTGQGAKFPSPTGGDYFLLTLIGVTGTTETSWEIVKCTARSTDTLTIVRAQEGTSDATWAAGTRVELRVTAAPLADVGQITTLAKTDGNIIVGDGSKWVAESGATARTSLGLGTAATSASTDFAPAAQGVTNGNSHNHDGGDGAQIAYSSLSGTPTLGDSASKNVGTTTGSVAAGDHTHSGVYEPADATILKSAAIGSTVQAYDADLTALGGLAKTDGNIIVGNGTTWVAESGATARTSLGLGTADNPEFLTVDPTNGVRTTNENNTAGSGNSPLYHAFSSNAGIKTFYIATASGANQGIKIHLPVASIDIFGSIKISADYFYVNALGLATYNFAACANNSTNYLTDFAIDVDVGYTADYISLHSITHATSDHIFEFRRVGTDPMFFTIVFDVVAVYYDIASFLSSLWFETFTYS
jgi:hypothetical protein